MKKIYIKPTIQVVVLQQQGQLLAGSQHGMRFLNDSYNPEGFVRDEDDLDDDDILR
jgi:hypothetical protein